MTAKTSIFPQMFFFFPAPLLFFFVLVDTISGFTRNMALSFIFTLPPHPPRGAERLNKPELVENTDSKDIASQTSSKQFLNVYCALQFIKSLSADHSTNH